MTGCSAVQNAVFCLLSMGKESFLFMFPLVKHLWLVDGSNWAAAALIGREVMGVEFVDHFVLKKNIFTLKNIAEYREL